MHALEAINLTKSYGGVRAVDDVSFTVGPGRIVAFLGPNGAGKTSTLQLMLGLAEPDSGSARIFDQRYADLDRPSSVVGALLDSGGLHPGRSGRNHLRVLAAAAKLPPARVEQVLALVGMEQAAHRPVKTYSLGMKQRIGLAAALLGDPRILILDEPANGLDPAGMRWLRELLRRFADDGGTVLLASHVLAEVADVAHDVVVIGSGKVLAAAPLADFAAGRRLEDTYLELTATHGGMR
ncbi:ATP-binding cassette domain-containing protein [Georgenia sp. TF02-10]|uniref:ATP-binding cassette domain-containing protein n=1 Tax=Georgenia sp. TF02-10 TaxID=2917725 RepID=UPI001FA75801|nr:ATP-binding cassette domain-containing protein [Georgenia sp. TF02-10]UNX54558.1 ATP-binding cassette domain-containing protein [Georgenia sp. TF02-10]